LLFKCNRRLAKHVRKGVPLLIVVNAHRLCNPPPPVFLGSQVLGINCPMPEPNLLFAPVKLSPTTTRPNIYAAASCARLIETNRTIHFGSSSIVTLVCCCCLDRRLEGRPEKKSRKYYRCGCRVVGCRLSILSTLQALGPNS